MQRIELPSLRKFGSELRQCGFRWGEDVDLSGSSIIKRYVGQSTWIETAIEGVIGMHGNEPGKGPAIIIQDVEHSDIEMIWTNGLIGCMCIAITGRDEFGKLNVFFTHARSYDSKDAINDPTNPMHLACIFIESHRNIRIYWGTDFNFGVNGFAGYAKRIEAQKLLSNALGYWFRESDCVTARSLVFFPKFGILKDGNPREAYAWARSQDLNARYEFSRSKELSQFIPDPNILKEIHDHLIKIQNDRTSWVRFYLYDARRSNKIIVMEYIINAYLVGNLDILRYFAKHAVNKSSPFIDESGANAWDSLDASATRSLVLKAYHDAKQKIQTMGMNGCGLNPDGSDIHTFKEYMDMRLINLKITDTNEPHLTTSRTY